MLVLYVLLVLKLFKARKMSLQRRRRCLEEARRRIDVIRTRTRKQRMLLALAFLLTVSPPIERRFWVSSSRLFTVFVESFYYYYNY